MNQRRELWPALPLPSRGELGVTAMPLRKGTGILTCFSFYSGSQLKRPRPPPTHPHPDTRPGTRGAPVKQPVMPGERATSSRGSYPEYQNRLTRDQALFTRKPSPHFGLQSYLSEYLLLSPRSAAGGDPASFKASLPLALLYPPTRLGAK